jgi:hypothetical protein
MHKVHKTINYKYYIASSEPYTIYAFINLPFDAE